MPIAASDLAALIGAVLLAGIGGEAFLKSILGAGDGLRCAAGSERLTR